MRGRINRTPEATFRSHRAYTAGPFEAAIQQFSVTGLVSLINCRNCGPGQTVISSSRGASGSLPSDPDGRECLRPSDPCLLRDCRRQQSPSNPQRGAQHQEPFLFPTVLRLQEGRCPRADSGRASPRHDVGFYEPQGARQMSPSRPPRRESGETDSK